MTATILHIIVSLLAVFGIAAIGAASQIYVVGYYTKKAQRRCGDRIAGRIWAGLIVIGVVAIIQGWIL